MEWINISDAVTKYFGDATMVDGVGPLVRGISPEYLLTLSTDSKELYIGPIDWTWGSDDTQINGKLDAAKALYLLRCNQVEILIREASALIERALTDVMKYDQLNVERFKVLTEFAQYHRTHEQELAEQADPAYWDGLATEADLSAQAKSSSNLHQAEIIDRYAWAVKKFLEASSVAYGKDDIARQTTDGDAATTTATSHQYSAQVSANNLENLSNIARREYEAHARAHQLRRQYIVQEAIGIKLNEVMRPGGALNYNEQMREIGGRALNDFLEVVARLNAIDVGLRGIFFVEDSEIPEIDKELAESRTRVEGAVNWLRKVANTLSRATMDEQEFIVRLTLEPQAPGQLLAELKSGYILTFASDLLAKAQKSRLRGISATGESLDGDTWIDIEIMSPEQVLNSFKITLPSVMCRLGRVSSSASLNVRDVVGGRPILNRSPVGDWIVRALRHDRGDKISRLHLDFHLAFCQE
ncbi:hypothetical protein [Rhizobium leguminosarum]|uniref:hypothetical protein n=1 Tax=Rhizobium leguminosarum TaxID=384 RepID=UPI003D05C001